MNEETQSLQTQQASKVPCCPELDLDERCDILTFDYRLTHNLQDVPVEVKIRARLERCTGALALGDLVHSTTLLPGEKVRLFSANRHNRFTFDRDSQVSYRHEQTSEETYYMDSMSHFMSDVTVVEDVDADRSSQGSWNVSGSTSGAIETFFAGASANASGSHNSSSTFDFMRELHSHAEASHERSVEATRAASSVSIGEVQTRSHAEGESESTFESATRTLCNPNQCRAITFFSYQINKIQTMRFVIESVTRRVIDAAADTAVTSNLPRTKGGVEVIPQAVLATDANRVNAESLGRTSLVADRAGILASSGDKVITAQPSFTGRFSAVRQTARVPLSADVRQQALRKVDEDLVKAGLIDKVGGSVSPEVRNSLSFEKKTSLPTGGILVKGCLDDCSVCEPELEQKIQLDLQHKQLKNELLKRQIELLEESQEYRCCPADEQEDDSE